MNLLYRAISQGEDLQTKDGYDKHINLDGSREHVISYNSNGMTCSHKNCIVNKNNKSNFQDWIFIK